MLAERLKDLRAKKGVTQDDVADFIGVSKSAYGYYEAGRNMPSVETLLRLAKYFSVSTDYLLGRESVSYIQAASTPLGDTSDLSQEDQDAINEYIELKRLKRFRDKEIK